MTLRRAVWPVVLLVAVAVAVAVNRIQMALWSHGCADVFDVPAGASAACAAPGALDVPLFWLAPLLGVATGYACLRLLAVAVGGNAKARSQHADHFATSVPVVDSAPAWVGAVAALVGGLVVVWLLSRPEVQLGKEPIGFVMLLGGLSYATTYALLSLAARARRH